MVAARNIDEHLQQLADEIATIRPQPLHDHLTGGNSIEDERIIKKANVEYDQIGQEY